MINKFKKSPLRRVKYITLKILVMLCYHPSITKIINSTSIFTTQIIQLILNRLQKIMKLMEKLKLKFI